MYYIIICLSFALIFVLSIVFALLFANSIADDENVLWNDKPLEKDDIYKNTIFGQYKD